MEASPRDTAQGAEYGIADDDDQLGPEGYGLTPEGYGLTPEGGRLSPDGPDEQPPGAVSADGSVAGELPSGPEVEVELRPQRRLRVWQLAPIVALAAVGSLMFAFPLAFEFG
ncbi:MAG: hypothetical protein LBV60_23060, partial [Streptomyces sp.]|nr:hypothetical protein [Streptomyces sp.]